MRFSRLSGLLFSCLWLAFVQGVMAAAPAPFEADYDVEVQGMHVATLRRVLSVAPDGRYQFESRLQMEGLAALLRTASEREVSRGQVRDEQLRPESYEHERQSGKKRRLELLDFDWAAKTVSGQDGTTRWQAELFPGTTDKLAYQLRLMRDIGSGEKLEYRIAGDGRVKVQVWQRLGKEKIKAGRRAYDAVKVEYVGRGNRRTRLWCAPELGFLPVRIEYEEKNGNVMSAVLRVP